MTELRRALGGPLDERGRPADVDARRRGRRPGRPSAASRASIAPREAGPVRRARRASACSARPSPSPRAEPLELVAIEHVLERAGRSSSRASTVARACAARWRSIAISGTSPEPPATSSSGPPSLASPDEVAADRAAQLELVAGPQLVGQVRRDLAVVDPLDRQLDRWLPRAPRRSSSERSA